MPTALKSSQPARTLALYAGVFLALTSWTWRAWPDPLVDFGRELYMPWMILRGKVLYRDIASMFGPLSPYVNALWFRLFGVSLLTLAFCNLAIFAALLAGLHRLIRISAGRAAATASGLVCLVLLGFSQYVEMGNYNFVTPYAHEVTHGLALSVAMMVLLHRALGARGRIAAGGAGLCYGLVLLTKPEMAVAATAAALAAWTAAFALGREDRRHLATAVPLFAVSAAIAPLLFFLYFAGRMDRGAALLATAGAWAHVFDPGMTANEFYRNGMGLDTPLRNAGLMLLAFAAFVAFIAAAAAVSWYGAGTRSRPGRARLLRLALVGVVILLVATPGRFPRALPLIVIATLGIAWTSFLRARAERDRAVRLVPLLVCAAFALGLLAKMGLNARVHHYGFCLALPAMAVTVALLTGVIPEAIASRGSDAAGRTFRALALLAIAAAIAPYAGLAYGWNRTRTIAIGDGADRFYASAEGPLWYGRGVRDALASLDRVAAPGDTLAVLPEGITINYLRRMESPLRVINMTPPAWIAFGEEDVLRSLAAHPPTFVLLVQRDVREYDYPEFGTDARYGLRTRAWIDARYEHVRTIRQGPGAESPPAMELLRQRAHTTGAGADNAASTSR